MRGKRVVKRTRKIKNFYVLAILVVLLFSIGSYADAKTVPKINCKKVILIQGKKKKLKISGVLAKKVKWKSKNNLIATVSRKGVVRAKNKGKTIVIGKVGKKKFRCKITVKAKKVVKKKKKHEKDLYDVADDKANAAILELFGGHPEKYSEAERAYKVADWICSHVKYSTKDYYETYNGETYYVGAGNWETGLLKGTAKCSGFASLYVYMGWKVNLEFKPCLSAEANHAMNIVKIDGKYYWIDLTSHAGQPKLRGRVFCSKYTKDWNYLKTFSNIELCTSTRFDDLRVKMVKKYYKVIYDSEKKATPIEVSKEEFEEGWNNSTPENREIVSTADGDTRYIYQGKDREFLYYEDWRKENMYDRGDYMNY